MEGNVEGMRPRLRGDVYITRVQEGTYIRSNLGGSMLRGGSTYEFLQRIAPMLDGTRTLGELCADVPESSRAALSRLILLLHGKGYVKNVLDDRPHTLAADVTEAYAANIAFIEYFTDSPALRFEHYRESAVVLAGSGPLLQALVNAQLSAGARRPVLAPFPESPFDRDRVAEHLAIARERDPGQRVGYLDVNPWKPGLVATDAAMVLHVADRPMIDRARLLPEAAHAAGAAFAQAVVTGDEAWIGPVIGADGDATAWESAWRRLAALAPATVGADLRDHAEVEPSEFLRGPTVSLVANHLSFAAFRHLAGIDSADRSDRLVRFDLESLETANHVFVPHPLARPAVPDDPARLATLTVAATVDDEELARRAVDCVDARTGVFAEITERDYEQIPLFVSEVVVSDPMGLAGGPFPVHGCGESVVESRQRAVRRAFERYAGVMADVRRGDRLHGLDVLTGKPVAVDAAEVFRARTGSSGSDWSEAVRAAVVAAAGENLTEALSNATEPLRRLNLDGAETTTRGARYLKLLEIVDQEFEVYDLSGLLGLPTFAFTTPDGTATYASDLDVDAALEKGLEQTLLHYQAVTAEQPAYAPAPVPDLPAELRGETGARPESVTLDQLVAWLTRGGGRVVVVPLDHDAYVARLCPFAVRAVIVHG